MTTIAYSKGRLACDSRMTESGFILTDEVQKVYVLSDGTHVGFSGSVGNIETLRRQIVDNGAFSTEDLYDVEETDALAVTKDGKLYYLSDDLGNFIELRGREHFAIGSGGDFALGALYAGSDLRTALEIAIRLDSISGGEIHEYDVVSTKTKSPDPVASSNRVVPLRRK